LKKVRPDSKVRGRSTQREDELLEEDVDGEADGMDGSGVMDVDDPSPEAHDHSSVHPTSHDATPTPMPIAATNSNSSSTIAIRRQTSRSSSTSSRSSTLSPSAQIAKMALHTALQYGQTLEADYKNDHRPEVRGHLKRTFGVVAYPDPLAAGGEVAEMAGQEARARLANELNQAILESQGKPAHPALEMLYRQTAACVVQLGLMNVGAAAFADMSTEFLEG